MIWEKGWSLSLGEMMGEVLGERFGEGLGMTLRRAWEWP